MFDVVYVSVSAYVRLMVGRIDEGNGGGGEECMGEHMYTYIIYSYVIKSVSAFVQRSERIRMKKKPNMLQLL